MDATPNGTKIRDLGDGALVRRIVASRLPGPEPTAPLNTILPVLDEVAERFRTERPKAE